jgi:uncharacterized membrane protein YqgA involved in biofilm formation
MKDSVTLRMILALSISLGSVVGGCRSMENTMNRISSRTNRSLERVTSNIHKTERKMFNSLPNQK